MKYFVESQGPGRAPQRFALEEASTRVGSGDEADLKLEGTSLAPFHLTIEPRADGAALRALEGISVGFITDGAQQHEALVPWGAEAFVGGVRLTFLAEEAERRGTSPWLLLALGGALALLGWQGADVAAAGQVAAVEPPSLAVPAAPCPEHEPEAARDLGRRKEHTARARQQRYPFDASEGIKVIDKYQVAAACLQVAGDAEGAARVASARAVFEEQLNADYAGLRLRLQLAMGQERWRDARRAAEALEALVAPLGQTPYRAWLGSVKRGSGVPSAHR